jgi:hypothetical protein
VYAYCPLLWKQKLIQQKNEGQKKGKREGASGRHEEKMLYEEMIFCNLVFFIVVL